jgi:hypothetical protein
MVAPDSGQWRNDAEALGRIVQPESDNQKQREGELAGSRGVADGQTFGEVMQANSARDHHRELPTRRWLQLDGDVATRRGGVDGATARRNQIVRSRPTYRSAYLPTIRWS